MSIFTAQIKNFLNAAEIVKMVNSKIIVVGGGPHFSVVEDSFLIKYKYIDYLIAGEGEYSFLELLKAIKKNKNIEKIDGLIYRKKLNSGKLIIKRNPINFIKNLDLLPFPAYHLIDMEMFFKFQSRGLCTREGALGRAVTLITSRGCPYKCIFCSIRLHMGTKFRKNSVEYTISHIIFLKEKYDIKHLFFEDDNLTFDLDRFKSILDGIIKKKINIRWDTPNGVRVDSLTEKSLIAKMKKAGCKLLIIAAESGEPKILKNVIKKNIELKDVIKVAKWCKEYNLNLCTFFTFGYPGETIFDINKTFKFAEKLFEKYDVTPIFNRATPLIGTELHKIVIKNKYLRNEITPESLSEATYPNGDGLIETCDFTSNQLSELYEKFSYKIRQILLKKVKNNLIENNKLLNYYWPFKMNK